MSAESSFLKKNFQFIYSLILIILIPGTIAVNTFLVINNNRKSADIELQRKAALAEEVFAASVADSLEDPTALQQKITQIITTKDSVSKLEIAEIAVMIPQNDSFKVIASSVEKNINASADNLEYTITWSKNQSIATLISQNGQRYWNVITPLTDLSGEKKAIVDMKVSLSDADALAAKNLKQSQLILIVSIVAVLLLLVNHFRFFEQAILFRRLKEVDQMKDDFISIASHELKTPLAAIKGYLSMVFEGVAGSSVNPKAKEYLEKVQANTRRLDALVKELLDVSRLEQGRMKFELKPVDISTLISQVVDELKVKADEKSLKVTYEPPADPKPQILADNDRIAQILDNLIGNAIKYTLKGSVTITHKIEDNKLKTIIKDTGVGMSAADRENLFSKFYRIKTKKTEDIPGTGLGLWITREIIHKMNGEIFVDSMEDVGSQFTVSFPIATEKDIAKLNKKDPAANK